MPSQKSDKVAVPSLGYATPGDVGLPPVDRGADVVRWLFPAYIFLILVGFFVLRGPGIMPAGNDLNPDRAVFTSVNAATLTGFQLSIHPTIFFLPGKILLLVLTVAGTLFSVIVGGMAVKRIVGLTWSDLRIVRAAVAIEVFVLVIGAFASGGGGAPRVIAGMTQAAAAWGNSGLYLGAAPAVGDLYTHVVLLPLSVLGGLGIVVVIQVFDALLHRRPLIRHSRLVLQMTAGLFLTGFVGCVLLQLLDLEALGWRPPKESYFTALARTWSRILTTSSITSVDARTAGMPIVPVYGFPRGMSFFVMLLMVIGGSPGGSAGGLKTTTLYELIRGPWQILRGRGATRALGVAATWLGIYAGAATFFQIMLLWAEPQMPGDRLLFVTVSALSNVGLSHDVLSMTRSSLLLVSAAMFVGRLTPLLILWWMADTTRDAEVAVG